ncbi:MAG: PIN domain-containing protein [Chloroflexi bacterium]|nr:PIN domain-containing protein [Chloroflexota bacterium]
MTRVFLDSSVLFSAAYSIHGHAHDLIMLGIREEITIVTSQMVFDETQRNLFESAPEKLTAFDLIIANVHFEFVRPLKRDVLAATKHVALKDAPIVAAARKAKVEFLVTLDKKHLLNRPDLARYVRAAIVTPKEAIERLVSRS